jgi:hypothetical protein
MFARATFVASLLLPLLPFLLLQLFNLLYNIQGLDM